MADICSIYNDDNACTISLLIHKCSWNVWLHIPTTKILPHVHRVNKIIKKNNKRYLH